MPHKNGINRWWERQGPALGQELGQCQQRGKAQIPEPMRNESQKGGEKLGIGDVTSHPPWDPRAPRGSVPAWELLPGAGKTQAGSARSS